MLKLKQKNLQKNNFALHHGNESFHRVIAKSKENKVGRKKNTTEQWTLCNKSNILIYNGPSRMHALHSFVCVCERERAREYYSSN